MLFNKKIPKCFPILALLLGSLFFLSNASTVVAKEFKEIKKDFHDYKNLMKPSGNQDYYELVENKTESGEGTLAKTFLDITNTIRGILVFFGIVWLGYASIRVITAGDDDQNINNFKSSVKWISIALVISVLILELPKLVFNFDVNNPTVEGGVLDSDEGAESFAVVASRFIMEKIVSPIYFFTASIAILFLVVSGLRMISAAGDSGKIDKQKANVKFVVVGLFVTLLSEPLVRGSIFKKTDKGDSFTMDAAQMTTEIMGFLNYCLLMVAAVLLASTVFSGLMMIVEIGKEDLLTKSKKAFINNLIGFMIIFCSLAAVQTIISATSGSAIHVGIRF